jgi:tetratricopeptide (TPR) repeat protein
MRYVIPLSVLPACLLAQVALADVNPADIDKAVKEGRYSDAGRLWEQRAANNPNRADVQLGYARFLQSIGQTDPATKEFQRALALKSDLSDAYVGLAEISLQILDVPNALAYARKALAYDQHSPAARIVEVNALMQSGSDSQADEELKPLLDDGKKNPEVMYLAYEVKAHKGDLLNARQYLQQAVNLDGNRVDWAMDLCTLLESAGDYGSAKAYLQEAIEREPHAVDVRVHMARHLEVFEKDYDHAIQQYQAALEIKADLPAALAGIDRCQAKKNDLARRLKLSLQQLFSKH